MVISVQVNFLSLALLTVLLLPTVLNTSAATASAAHRPRITLVTSDTHFWIKSASSLRAGANMLAELNEAGSTDPDVLLLNRYPLSKRAARSVLPFPQSVDLTPVTAPVLVVFFTRELAARLPPTRAIVNTVNPGLCRSALFRRATLPQRAVLLSAARPAELGGRLIAWAALADRYREGTLHGKYVSDMEVREESDLAVSRDGYAMQRRLWVGRGVHCIVLLGALTRSDRTRSSTCWVACRRGSRRSWRRICLCNMRGLYACDTTLPSWIWFQLSSASCNMTAVRI
jgi:retinol dehydrogenase-12